MVCNVGPILLNVTAAGGSHRKTDRKREADESDVTDVGGEAAEYR